MLHLCFSLFPFEQRLFFFFFFFFFLCVCFLSDVFSEISLLSHQSDASLYFLLNSVCCCFSVFLSDVFSEVLSANMSQLTLLLVICRGKSLIKKKNKKKKN